MQDSKFGEHLYLSPRVPQGLAAAVEGLTREVIRHRPENIYAFAAHHFENLLRLREQYDEPSSSSKKSLKHLHQVSEAVRERYEEPKDTSDRVEQTGWSLNETAKVLEKHRSIFGDTGQKVSTEQIRELANEPLLASRQNHSSARRTIDLLNEENLKCTPGTSRRHESPRVTQEASKNGLRNTPKILSQIPIAKDIKTELKRNRISSKERKKMVACEYTRETIIEKSSKKSVEKTKKSYEVRSERKSSRVEDSTKKRIETTKSRTNSHEEKTFTRGGNTDSVKNYVVQNFVNMTSLSELQTPSYVEKVQEVIDETSSIIKEKVEALKTGVARAAKAKRMKKESSTSSEEYSKSSSKSNSEKRSREASLTRRYSKIAYENIESENKIAHDQDVSEASELKSSLPAVRPPSSKSTSRSMSARSDSDAATLTLPPISPESAKSPKVKEELVLPMLSPPRNAVAVGDTTPAVVDIASEDAAILSEKIVQERIVEKIVPSNKNITALEESTGEEEAIDENNTETIRSKDSEGNAEEKCVPLEEIIDEKPRPPLDEKQVTVDKSMDSEQSDRRKVLTAEQMSSENIEEVVISEKQQTSSEAIVTEKESANRLEVKEEEFHDSLNVTPEPFDTKGQRPDSLENSSAEDSKSGGSSGHLSPLETLKDKLLEIEQVQKRIEDVLDDTKTSKVEGVEGKTDEATTGAKIEDKLIEIQESEKRIEQILDSQSTSEIWNSDIKNKLQELEEVERRIESIFSNDTIKECSDKSGTPVIDLKDLKEEIVGGGHESREKDERKELIARTNDNLNLPGFGDQIDEKSNDERIEETRAISPHSYILTEGSPYEIPDSVTTVIIPDRTPYSPDSEISQVEKEDDPIRSTVPSSTESKIEDNPSSNRDAVFGEIVESSDHLSEPSTVDIEYVRGIKASHDMIVSRENNLDRIKEERDEAEVVDSEDEKVLKVVTSSLEEILDKEQVEYVQIQRIVKYHEEDEKLEIVDNSLESTARSIDESTNEVKETSIATDRSSLSLDPAAPVSVPELNLDSLPDLTISSFNMSDKDSSLSEASTDKVKSASLKRDSSLDVGLEAKSQQFDEQLMQRNEPTAASDIGVPALVDINNVVCSSSDSVKDIGENNLPTSIANASQCTATEAATGLIDANRQESMIDNNRDDRRDDHADDKKSCHIYVPETSNSKDVSSSTETSTFMSAATKIQAGVRGFLTRRRLQSTQKRSSTLDSVPSIQESFTVETNVASVALMPIVETTTSSMSETKSRKKLRREDAVQRTTLSVENAFAENQLQHTGEFYDCIPLPVFDAETLSLKTIKQQTRQNGKVNETSTNQVEQLLEKILLGHAATNFSSQPKLVDVLLLPVSGADATDLQNKYLNFITSVEDVFSDLPETPKGVIIEEITSLDDTNKSITGEIKKDESTTTMTVDDQALKPLANDSEETLASISTSEDPLSINIEEALGLGDEDEPSCKSNRLNGKLSTVDRLRSNNVSQDSPISDERTRSPVTMMQIGTKSIDEKSEENPT